MHKLINYIISWNNIMLHFYTWIVKVRIALKSISFSTVPRVQLFVAI